MEDLRDWIALHRIGWTRPQTIWDVVLRCGDVGKLLHAPRDQHCSLLDSDWTAIEQLRHAIDWKQADLDLEFISKRQIRITPRGSTKYPPQLDTIHDAPLVLFWRGEIPDWNYFTGIAIVGSRKATSYGREVVTTLVPQLVLSTTIISGLAFGIDAEAHRACIAARGKTIAVLASGIDDITPNSHQKLGELIIENGALCSEAPLGEPAYPANFLSRNRIISGLSRATIVIEAAARSGSLVTARLAAEQGRDVFAVPGSITSPLSAGCNQLIKEGAAPLCSVESINELLFSTGGTGGMFPSRACAPSLAVRSDISCERGNHHPVTGPVENRDESTPPLQTREKYGHSEGHDDTTARLFETLSTGPCTANDLVGRLDMPISKVLQLLTELECAGMLKVLPGGFVSRN